MPLIVSRGPHLGQKDYFNATEIGSRGLDVARVPNVAPSWSKISQKILNRGKGLWGYGRHQCDHYVVSFGFETRSCAHFKCSKRTFQNFRSQLRKNGLKIPELN